MYNTPSIKNMVMDILWYCYIFNIRYDVAMRIESKDMSFEAFREWLSDYINEYCSDVYEEITVFGIYDDVYVK